MSATKDADVALLRRCIAEFLGTAALLAVVVGSGIMGETLAHRNDAVALLGNSIATGAGLVVLISILGPLSGAHFNPAVTFTECVASERPWRDLLPYALAQVLGGLAGVALAHGMFDQIILQTSLKTRASSGLWLAEVVATAGLIVTIRLGIAHARSAVPTLVALYITAAYWFTASTSFANPAVTLARSFTNTFSGIAPNSVAAFVAAQLVGALLGLGLARVLLPSHRAA